MNPDLANNRIRILSEKDVVLIDLRNTREKKNKRQNTTKLLFKFSKSYSFAFFLVMTYSFFLLKKGQQDFPSSHNCNGIALTLSTLYFQLDLGDIIS